MDETIQYPALSDAMAVTIQKLTSADTKLDIPALRRQLAEERRSIEEREKALDVVEQMLKGKQHGSANGANGQLLDALGHGYMPPANGLTDGVRTAIETLGNAEFTVADIEGFFKRYAMTLPKKNPRPRIAMVLQTMREREEIDLVEEGTGRMPNKYRRARK